MTEGIGERLREARESHGIELDDAERQIKIRKRFLVAMEEERWEVLPGAAYVREQLQSIIVMVSPDGTRAAAEFTVQGAYVRDDAGLPPARGQRYTLHAGTFFNIHAGQLRRVSEYANLQELIAQLAVG